jgi:DNA-binding transcriptional LysR family regulator
MELRQLSYFVAVAEELHFGRAAERLHIVQPAVSQQVRRLERELGVELFDRSPRRVTLTAAGARFLPEARAVLAAAARARATVTTTRSVSPGVLRLGTSAGLGDHLERLLDRLAPGLTVELVYGPTAERAEQVRDGRLDATFVRGTHRYPGLRRIPAWQEPLFVALSARHPLAGKPGVKLADLAPFPLRLTERRNNTPLVDLVVGACHEAGYAPVPAPVAAVLADSLALIGADDSWTVVYAAHARQVRSGRVVFRPLAGTGLALSTALLVRPDSPAPAVDALLDALASDDNDS